MRTTCTILAVLLASSVVPSQAVTSLGDLNPTPTTREPSSVDPFEWPYNPGRLLNDPFSFRIFFVAEGANGIELYSVTPTIPSVSPTLTDVRPGPGSSLPGGLTAFNNRVYFFADDGTHGRELMVVNGQTPNTATLVKDINPGPVGSTLGDGEGFSQDPHEYGAMVEFNGMLYFVVDAPGVAGLWRTDGTDAGTTQVLACTPMPPGQGTSSDADFPLSTERKQRVVTTATHVFWAADDNSGLGFELWSYDGTNLIPADINAGPGDSNPDGLTAWGGDCYCRADDGSTGVELFKASGGGAVVQVADLEVGAGDSEPGGFFDFTTTSPASSQLLFSATTSATGRDLYSTDGNTISLVSNLQGGSDSDPKGFVQLGNEVYYSAEAMQFDAQLFKTDGTTTTQLTDQSDLNGIFGNGGGLRGGLIEMQGKLYFYGSDTSFDTEIVCYDPVTDVVTLVQDIQPPPGNISPFELTIGAPLFGTFLFFHSGVNGAEPYLTDGTNVQLVDDINALPPGATNPSFPSHVVSLGTKSYFAALQNGEFSSGGEWVLFETDGTPSGTQRVAAVPPSAFALSPFGTADYFSNTMLAYEDKLYFDWAPAAGEHHLCSYEPATNTFTVISDGVNMQDWSGFGPGSDLAIAAYNGKIFYNPNGDLAIYDPNVPLLQGFNPAPLGVGLNILNIQVAGARLYLTADDGLTGLELWESDGTAVGTTRLTDTNVGGDGMGILVVTSFGPFVSEDPTAIALVDDHVLFFANDGATPGRELYVYDRANPGVTKVLAGGHPLNSRGLDDARFQMLDGEAYFMADDGNTGVELWKYGGGVATLVADVNPSGDGYPLGSFTTRTPNPAAVDGKIVFAATDGSSGIELWATTGPGNLTQLADINLGFLGSDIRFLRSIGSGQAYFTASNASNGAELWTTDGTPGGTLRLTDIQPSSGSGIVDIFDANIAYVPGGVLFRADDGVEGTELWHVQSSAVSFPLKTSYPAGRLVAQPSPPTVGGVVDAPALEATLLPEPELHVTDAEIGMNMEMSISGTQAASLAAIWISAPQDPMNSLGPVFGAPPGDPLPIYVDLGLLFATFSPSGQTGDTFDFPPFPVPVNPSIQSLTFAMQGLVVQPNGRSFLGITTIAFTNAVFVKPGF